MSTNNEGVVIVPKGEKYFLYDGKSSLDFGLIIDTLPEDNPAEFEVTKYNIPGRDGIILIGNERRKSKLKNITAHITGANKNELEDKINKIKNWLQKDTKFKKLILSHELNKYYEAVCLNSINFTEMWDECSKLLIIFECQPYKKLVNEEIIYITDKDTVVNNVGANSKPHIKVVGSGDINISINSQNLILKGIEGNIEIDCEYMNAYKKNSITGIITNENHKMYSDFPILESGENNITWSGSGTISRIEITPKVVFV